MCWHSKALKNFVGSEHRHTKQARPRRFYRPRLEARKERITPSDSLTQSLFPDPTGPQQGVGFGYSVATDTNFHVVGAPSSDVGGFEDCGVAFVYDNTTGALIVTLANPTPASYDLFGYSAAVSGNTVVAGVYGDDTQNVDQGAAYVFSDSTETTVSQSGGNVTIDDAAGTNDQLTLSRVNVAGVDYLRVTDPTNPLVAGPGAIQINANTVDVQLSTITGSVTINSGGGDDTPKSRLFWRRPDSNRWPVFQRWRWDG